MKRLFTLALVLLFAVSMNAQKSVYSSWGTEKHETKVQTVKKQRAIYTPNSKGTIFSENFDTWPPSSWNFVSLGDPAGWQDAASNSKPIYLGANAAFHNDDNVSNSCNDWMVSPAITIPNVTQSIIFSCWQYEHYPTYYEGHQIVVLDGQDPATDNILDTLYEGVGTEDTWEQITANLDAYKGQTIYIGFRYVGDYADEWNIDEMSVYYPEPDNLAVSGAAPVLAETGDDVVPSVTVTNAGTDPQDDFDVKVFIYNATDTVYSSTLNVTGAALAPGADSTFEMADTLKNAAEGTYTMSAIVVLTGDSDNSNDTLNQEFDVVTFSYNRDIVYGFDAADWTSPYDMDSYIVTIDPVNATLDSLQNSGQSEIYAGDFVGDFEDTRLVGLSSSGKVFLINGDGAVYYYGTISGVNGGTYGFTWSKANDKVYVSTIASDGYSYLYSVNEDLTADSIGMIDTTLVIGIACDSDGNLFAIDLSDNLISVDTATGAGTVVGELGVNINYAQDIGFDRTTNTLYGTLYLGGGTGGLYTIDVTTGTATQIESDYGDEVTLCAMYSSPTYMVTFNVTDTTGTALDSAEIVVGTDTLYTDASGQATLDLFDGSYTAHVTLDGYTDVDSNFTVAGQDTTVNIELTPLPPTYTVTFNVTDTASNALENAEIVVGTDTLMTDSVGQATIELADGSYTAVTTLAGYNTDTTDFTVAGQDTTVNITLTPASTYTITLNVDMTAPIADSTFDPANDTVFVTGSFFGWAAPGTLADKQTMADNNSDGIYTVDVLVDSLGHYEYKYFKNSGWANGEWDGDPNRSLDITGDTVVNDVWGSLTAIKALKNVEVTIAPNPVENVVRISADNNYNVVVYNIEGKAVASTQMRNNVTEIDFSNFQSGVYIIKVYNNTASGTYKLIKR